MDKKTIEALARAYQEVTEKLVGGQKELDQDKDGDIDKHDFAKLRAKKKKKGKDDPQGEKGETATMNPKMDGSKTEQKEEVGLGEKLDKDFFHKSVEKGKFMTHKSGGSGDQNTLYLHDLDNKGSDSQRPMLVTFARSDKAKAEKAAKKFGGKLFQTRFGTFRIVKEEVEVDEALKPYDKNADFRVVNRLKPKQRTGTLTPAEKKQLANAQARLRNHGVTESFRDKLLSVLENREKHYRGAMDAEAHDDNWSPGAKKMQDDLGKMEVEVDGFKAADDTAKAISTSVKAAPGRPNDSKIGDKNIVNQVVDAMKGLKK